MNFNFNLKYLVIAGLILISACGKKEESKIADNQTVSILSANLKTVEEGYLPDSIDDDGTTAKSFSYKTADDEDICKGLDFLQCQPKLIRTYLRYGKSVVTSANQIVSAIAADLDKTGEVSSGTVQTDNGVTIIFNKRSHLDFELILLKANQPAGRIAVAPNLYTIQLDMSLVDNKSSQDQAGKLEMQLHYQDHTHWNSRLTITDVPCNTLKPDDPQSAFIEITRNGSQWIGQSALYNSISGDFASTKSCSNPATSDSGLVILTEFVADSNVAKASIYLFKASDTRTEYSQFGFNNYCENYPDRCQVLATSFGSTVALVDQHLNQFTNPYCVHRGNSEVSWNSSCENDSAAIAEAPFTKSSQWTSPFEFSQLHIQIPDHLN